MFTYIALVFTKAFQTIAPVQFSGAFLAQKFIVAFRDHDGGKRTSTASPDDAKAGKEE